MRRALTRSLSPVGGLLLICAAVAAQEPASTSPPLPAPGQLVDLGGWRLHLNCTGSNSGPTVVLEAGAGDFSVDWSLVQPSVARFARVCSYDRAGAGWSELGPRPRTFRQEVWELHTLLAKAGERPPYVLVGHSRGGWLVRIYQSRYPAEVAAIVLVEAGADDPTRMTREGKRVRSSDLATGRTIPPEKTADPLRESDIPARFREMIEPQAREFSRYANAPPRDKLPEDAQRMRTWSLGQIKHHVVNDNEFESEELAGLRAQRAQTKHPLGDMPLIVISRGPSEDERAGRKAGYDEHSKNHANLVALSRSGKQVIAERSGHLVPIDEPDRVVAAIQEVLTAARQRGRTAARRR